MPSNFNQEVLPGSPSLLPTPALLPTALHESDQCCQLRDLAWQLSHPLAGYNIEVNFSYLYRNSATSVEMSSCL